MSNINELVDSILDSLLKALLERYSLSYEEILRIVPVELLEEVVLRLIKRYGYKYDISCETYAKPYIVFYGAKPYPRAFELPEEDTEERVRKCLEMVKKIRSLLREEELKRRCRDHLLRIGSRWYLKISERLVIDDMFLYIYSDGKLRRNENWRIIYQKYKNGYRNAFVKWLGKKIDELGECLEILNKLNSFAYSAEAGMGVE